MSSCTVYNKYKYLQVTAILCMINWYLFYYKKTTKTMNRDTVLDKLNDYKEQYLKIKRKFSAATL